MSLKKFIGITFLFLLATSALQAQKLLQIEKYGSPEPVIRFYPGSEVTFKLKETPGWFTRIIKDIDVEQQLILFEEEGFVSIHDIAEIQQKAAKKRWNAIGHSLYIFGINWGFWSVASTLLGEPLTILAAIVPATAFVLGYLIKKLGNGKVWKFGKRKRKWLRVLDLGFGKPVIPITQA